MNNDSTKSQLERALSILKKAIEKRECIVTEGFINLGPDKLRKHLSITNNEDWNKLFDYLVLNKGVVRKCVIKYADFFYDLVASHGPIAMRKVFGIEDSKYDAIFEEIFDLIAVSKGALFIYVRNNCADFAKLVKNGKAGDLQTKLCLNMAKYQDLWIKILEIFVDAVCEDYYDDKAVDRGFYAFSLMMNDLREHRSLRSNAKMWVEK
jgi:hypothetical protein